MTCELCVPASVVDEARRMVQAKHQPDGYNIGVNIGTAAGQNRMHVHVHLKA